MRVICGHPNAERTSTTVHVVRTVNICMSTMPASSSGMAKKMSVTRLSTASTHPPR